MRYKLLIILLVFGCSTDLAPDEFYAYDLCFDEITVMFWKVIKELSDILYMLIRFCVTDFLLPTVDFISLALCNVNSYFQHLLYIWLLFYKHSVIYQHTVYGVRCFYSFRRTIFVRGVVAFTCVLTVLLTACILDTNYLVPYGWCHSKKTYV